MKKKKLVTLALALIMALASVPTNVNAATLVDIKEEKGNQDTQEALTKVILKVKQSISIPKECSVFNYDYYTYNYGQGEWNLRWNSIDESKYIYVNCDNDGNIISYHEYHHSNKRESVQLKYLKSELESTALNYLGEIYPDLKGHFQLLNSGYNGSYENSYYYTYQRVENGITMPDNTVTISVSAADKSLTSLSSNLIFGVKIPDAKKEISRDKAIAILKDNLKMELGYYNKVVTLADGTEKTKAYLAYTPNTSYISVDAKTGTVYTTRNEWRYTSTEGASAKDKGDGSLSNGLTQEEINKIEEMSDLISKEKAISIITENKYLLLDSTAKAVTATLTQQVNYLPKKEGNKTTYYWNVSFADPREPDYAINDVYRAHANARINAETGEIVSFSANTKSADYENPTDLAKYKYLYTEAKCQEIFETFVNSVNGERFKQTKLTGTFESYILAYNDTRQLVGGLGYRYDRFNEDIPYTYNYIYGDVDKVTGKVYSYGYSWNENVEFESPKGAISAQEAYDSFINLDGFEVVYEYNTINTYDLSVTKTDNYYYSEDAYSVDYEVRLVYSIEGISPKIISPFTKKQLDYNGDEVKTAVTITEYTDIKDSPYQRSIQLLSDIGLGYSKTKFLPNNKVAVSDLIQFTQAAGLNFDESLRKEIFSDYYVSRQTFAKYIGYLLGLKDIASIPGIFTTGFMDETKIEKDYIGYVAIAKGLTLLDADAEGKFNPQAWITRGEAADIIIRLLQK